MRPDVRALHRGHCTLLLHCCDLHRVAQIQETHTMYGIYFASLFSKPTMRLVCIVYIDTILQVCMYTYQALSLGRGESSLSLSTSPVIVLRTCTSGPVQDELVGQISRRGLRSCFRFCTMVGRRLFDNTQSLGQPHDPISTL